MSQSFAQTLSKLGSERQSAKLTVQNASSQTTSSQTSAARQNSVATAIASVPQAAALGFNALIPATAKAAPTTPPPPIAPSDTQQSADDAYWSAQPASVQQLRNITDEGQRSQMAGQFAAEGYSIDTPVMVWGWDASKTTELRQSFGYTWVPSAMQNPVTAAPGISGAAIVPYNPVPPPGSILV